uniref:Uncharacterized protein n=1 Tax=Strongyloides stercoralis TaxID=6248 RepID=A0AAF5HZ42_STRER
NIFLGCATFLLLIRITYELQLIETFVVSSIVDLLWCSTFRHYYCCFGGCCLIGAESEALRLFWSKMGAVVQLELNLDQGNFTGRNQRLLIYWVLIMKKRSYSGVNKKCNNADYNKEFIMEDVLEEIGGCCSTGAGSKTCKLFFGTNSFRINASYNSETRYYCCCFGGCCSTGTDSEALRLFWKELENSMKVVVEEVGGCCSTGTESKTCKLFFGRNSFRINASYDSETRYYCCCFGDCCSTGTDSEALRLFWKKVEDSMEAVVEGIGGCCCTGAGSKTCKLFFWKNSFRINSSYNSDTRYYCCCFGDCCSTGTDSEALRLFWKKLEDVPILQLNLKQRSFSKRERIYLELIYDKESRYVFLVQSTALQFRHYYCCFGGCCLTGTDSEAFRFFWKKVRNALTPQLNLKHRSSSVRRWKLLLYWS